jgi:putative redox protein
MARERKLSATAEARWKAGYRADVTVRQFRFVADEPPRSGGDDGGAMPTEYLLVALGPLTVKAVGTYDGPSFSAIDLEVEFEQEPPAGIDVLVEQASRVCYVSNTLSRSPSLTVTVSPA